MRSARGRGDGVVCARSCREIRSPPAKWRCRMTTYLVLLPRYSRVARGGLARSTKVAAAALSLSLPRGAIASCWCWFFSQGVASEPHTPHTDPR